MKLIAGIIATTIGLVAVGYSASGPDFAPLPDPAFDYAAATHDQKVAWMKQLSSRWISSSRVAEKSVANIVPSYAINIADRRLTVDLRNTDPPAIDHRAYTDSEKSEFIKMMALGWMKDCNRKLASMGVVDDAKIVVRMHTYIHALPTIDVVMSQETCSKFMAS